MGVKFLSFLGINIYGSSTYEYKTQDVYYIDKERQNFVQVSIYNVIKELMAKDEKFKNIKDSAVESFTFVTKDAKIINYLGEGIDKKKINYEPLSYYAEMMNLTPIDIYDGMSEEEIWKNFNIILDVIEYGDTIFVDVTNSARSIPILFMSLLNFAKVSKDIKIGGIFYGAFNFGKKNNEDVITEILNLASFDTVTDWSNSVDMLLTKGGSKRFCLETKELVNEIRKSSFDNKKLNNFIKNVDTEQKMIDSFFEAINFCDVKMACDKIKLLKDQMKFVKKSFNPDFEEYIEKIKPLMALFNKIETFIEDFKGLECENIKNTLSSSNGRLIDADQFKVVYNVNSMIELSLKFELYQQALTLINENITSIISYEMGGNIFSLSDRKLAEDYIYYINYLNGSVIKNANADENSSEKIHDFATEKNIEKHLKLSLIRREVSEYRNTINHANFNTGNQTVSKECDKIKNIAYVLKEYVLNMQ